MKARHGFVSNSSSSSFIIISKHGALTEEKIIKLVDVPKKSILFSIVKIISESIVNLSEETTLKDLMKEHYCEDVSELPDYIQEALKTKGKIYVGTISTDEGGLEAEICNMDIDYEDEEIVCKKEAF